MVNKEKNFVSAVVYVHNAENRIEKFLLMLIEVLENNFEHSEIICVDDCSNDSSLTKIKEVSKQALNTSISVINMSYFHGLELSMNAGTDMSIGDFVFEFDNTILDFDKSVIMETYYKSIGGGYDLVSASADVKEKFTSNLFYRVFNRYTEIHYRMNTESFRVLSRRVINRISSMNKSIPYRKAIYANCGLKSTNIKYDVLEKYSGMIDKKEKRYKARLAVDSLILFTNLGYSFSFMMTILMMILSVFMLVYSAVVYATAEPVAGWTTTILFLSVAFLGLFAVLTIIIKYLQLLVDLVFKRKQYSFESVEKITK